MTLDTKLRWKEHIKIKRKQLNLLRAKMEWLIGRRSSLSIHNKLLIYRQIMKPVWTYGIQLWGCSKKSNTNIIQVFQNKVIRTIVSADWYMRDSDIHRDLNMRTVTEETQHAAAKHQARLANHANQLAVRLLDTTGQTRRLRRTKPTDLMI